jgi:hypothetical protein
MKAKDSRGARRAAAKELWQSGNALAANFSDHWKTLNDEHAQKRHADEQRRKLNRSAR